MFPSGSPGAISCGPKVNTTRPFVLQTIPLIMGRWYLVCVALSLAAFVSSQH